MTDEKKTLKDNRIGSDELEGVSGGAWITDYKGQGCKGPDNVTWVSIIGIRTCPDCRGTLGHVRTEHDDEFGEIQFTKCKSCGNMFKYYQKFGKWARG